MALLGVDKISGDPSPTSFPGSFNQIDGPRVWKSVLSSKEYKAVKTDKWDTAIRLYLHECEVAGVFPFARSTQQGNSDTAVRFLIGARRRLQWYFKQIDMFGKIAPLYLRRQYHFSEDTFGVSTEVQLLPIEDPTFRQWLRIAPYPGFRPGSRATFLTRLVQKNGESEIRLEFDLQRKLKPMFWIHITCNTPLTFPTVGPLPSKDEMLKYAEDTIWLPLVRSHRYPGNTTGWRIL